MVVENTPVEDAQTSSKLCDVATVKPRAKFFDRILAAKTSYPFAAKKVVNDRGEILQL
jgi:phage antirepressor YoqD-like protein